jgi:protein phosphatase
MRLLPGNAQHIGARRYQQDSFGFADPDNAAFIAHAGFLAVVCDGMGGMEHGDAASRLAVHAFLEAYGQKAPWESIPAALERSTRAANERVLMLARGLGMVEGIGTTLAAAVVQDCSAYYISVGDSGLFQVSGGQIRTLNRPHVFANVLEQAVARGEITADAARAHPERESLTSYIGAELLDEIDQNLEALPLQEGDTILVASDGLFKTLSTEEIAASLDGDPSGWCETLILRTLAKQREFQDNVTVLSVTLASDSPQPEDWPVRPESPPQDEAHPPPLPAVAPASPPRSSRLPVWLALAGAVVAAALAAAWWYSLT